MRIAVVNHHLRDVLGGSELQCHLLAEGLTARGHEVLHVAIGAEHDPDPDRYADLGYPVVLAPRDPEGVARTVVDLRPDVVYWRFNRRGLLATVRACRAAGIPLVFAIAHVDDVTAWPSRPWPAAGATLRDRAADLRGRLRWRRELGAFRGVAAIASQRTDLIGRIPFARVPLQHAVPNVMDPSVEPFDWPRPYVAWVGNLKPRKRPELVPSIAAALLPHGIDLIVAGPAQDPNYRWLTEPVPDHPNLHHVGALRPPQVTGLLAGARCLAVSAMPEGFSNVMIQAWWGGTPTVTLDYDPDGVVAGERLGACADGDVDRFLGDVVRFAVGDGHGGPGDVGPAAEAGARAAAFAQTRFAREPVLDALEELLAEVVRTAGARR